LHNSQSNSEEGHFAATFDFFLSVLEALEEKNISYKASRSSEGTGTGTGYPMGGLAPLSNKSGSDLLSSEAES
jgi:hypothetical protein